MEHNTNVVILIPAYRPDEKLIQTIEALNKQYSIIVVDDGSGEAFAPIFQEAQQHGAMVIHHAVNLGKGRALKTGFNEIMLRYPGQGVVTADADGQHHFEDILSVAKALSEQTDTFVFGVRTFDQMPSRSRMGNTLMRFFFRTATGCKLSDTQTGLRGIPAHYLPAMMELKGERYEYEMSLLMELRTWNASYVEVPIHTLYFDGNKRSHFRGWKDGIRVFGGMLRYCVTSLISVGADYGLYNLFLWLPVKAFTPAVCFALARTGSCIVNYIGNRYFVFHQKKADKKSIVYYFLLVLFGIVVGSNGVRILTRINVPNILAKIIMDALLFFINYTVQKNFIFVNREQSGKKKARKAK